LRRVILAICATAVALVLLLSFKTHTQTGLGTSPAAALGSPAPGATDTPAAGVAGGSPAAGGAATARPGPSRAATPAASGAAAGAARTVTGQAWPTIYGPVQVRITVKAGKITAVSVPVYPEGTPRDYQINSFAIPQLNQETLAAGSAQIDMVSGATYTSQGYIGSLQNALDQLKS
jgi:uncharacterized protein with FMN-binding domain